MRTKTDTLYSSTDPDMGPQPGLAITTVLFSVLLIVISILSTLPFAAALMVWLALIGVLAVEEALHPHDEDDTIVIEPIQ